MKKAVFSFIIIIVGIGASFKTNTPKPAELIQAAYAKDILAFDQKLDVYLQAVKRASSANDLAAQPESILDLHEKCRLAYKKVEYLLAFFDGDAVKKYINGAPLPQILHQGGIKILEPEGLQILDELVVEGSFSKMLGKLENLQGTFAEIKAYEVKRPITDRQILEAMRLELVRIMSLGITGFDTPGTLNAIPEATAALTGMNAHFQYYKNTYELNTRSFKATSVLFEKSIAFLEKNKNFDSFDRLHFIREFINPLHEKLLEFHLEAGVENFGKSRLIEEAINYNAKTPFSKDFFNPYHYIYLRPKQDSKIMAELGKALFFDSSLSSDGKMSCGTCHKQELAFTDGLKKSIGNDGTETRRNSPTLINAVYSKRHFYDLRADKLENQIKDVFANEHEFHSNFDAVSVNLTQNEKYKTLFEKAFAYANWSKTKIDEYTITSALTAFIKNLQSFDAPFDRYMRRETETLDSMVVLGFNLFMGKAACGTCHFAPLFNGLVPPEFGENETEVLGVPADKETTKLDEDIGRFGNQRPHEAAEHFKHSFKTVTVRNVELTAPYMHNGVFDSLEEVVDFYNKGGGAGQGLEVPFQTLSADSLGLSTREQEALIMFMHSLTDSSFLYFK